jgi:glycosyltransferase involved in cell wall biosynthesis
MVTRDEIDILTIHTSRDLPMSTLSGLFSRRPVRLVYVQHMQLGRDKKDMIHTWEYENLDAWVTPLDVLAKGVRQRTHISPGKIRVIPFGIDLTPFTSGLPDKTETRRDLGLPVDAIVAGTVGRIDRKKGQDVLIKACAEIRSEGIPLHLLFVGEQTEGETQPYADELSGLIEKLDLRDSVTFSPFRRDIEAAYAAMDVFVLTSHSETYGMVTIEAMASGLPVVATDTGGTPGIVSDRSTGLLVPPEDADALRAALLELLNDHALATQLGEQARLEALRRFSHEAQCRLYESLFDELTSNGE